MCTCGCVRVRVRARACVCACASVCVSMIIHSLIKLRPWDVCIKEYINIGCKNLLEKYGTHL